MSAIPGGTEILPEYPVTLQSIPEPQSWPGEPHLRAKSLLPRKAGRVRKLPPREMLPSPPTTGVQQNHAACQIHQSGGGASCFQGKL